MNDQCKFPYIYSVACRNLRLVKILFWGSFSKCTCQCKDTCHTNKSVLVYLIYILVLLLNYFLNTTQSRRKRESDNVVFDDISLHNKPQIQFSCKIDRNVGVNSELTMPTSSTQSDQAVTRSGILEYQATVKDVKIGHDKFTEVLIEPKHHLNNIYVV